MATARNPNQEGDERHARLSEYLQNERVNRASGRNSTYTKKSSEGGSIRIQFLMAALLMFVALIFDGAQGLVTLLGLIPIVGLVFLPFGFIITIISFVTFFTWFKLLGVDYWKGKQAALKILFLFAMLVFGFIPFISIIPEITAGVLALIIASRIEDTVGDKGQLERIAHRRVQKRDAITRLNTRRINTTEKQYGGTERGQQKVEKERRAGEKRLNRFDRQTKRESARMVTRAVLGNRKKVVDGVTPAEYTDQRSRAGYYKPYEYAAEAAANDYSLDEATAEYSNETEAEYRKRTGDNT
jgi:hypothetical protein